MKRLILLTGPPRTGKTTILQKVVEKLTKENYRLGGMISKEIQTDRTRLGFEICDISTGRRGILAHVRQPTGPKIGKYRVNLRDLNSIGVAAIIEAVLKADAVAIDEIGPMELLSEEFVDAVRKVIAGQKPLIATIHHRVNAPIVGELKSGEEAQLVEVTPKNREQLPALITEKVAELIDAKLNC